MTLGKNSGTYACLRHVALRDLSFSGLGPRVLWLTSKLGCTFKSMVSCTYPSNIGEIWIASLRKGFSCRNDGSSEDRIGFLQPLLRGAVYKDEQLAAISVLVVWQEGGRAHHCRQQLVVAFAALIDLAYGFLILQGMLLAREIGAGSLKYLNVGLC